MQSATSICNCEFKNLWLTSGHARLSGCSSRGRYNQANCDAARSYSEFLQVDGTVDLKIGSWSARIALSRSAALRACPHFTFITLPARRRPRAKVRLARVIGFQPPTNSNCSRRGPAGALCGTRASPPLKTMTGSCGRQAALFQLLL